MSGPGEAAANTKFDGSGSLRIGTLGSQRRLEE